MSEDPHSDTPLDPPDRSLGDRMFGERVLDAVPEVVLVLDRTGRCIWWNSHAVDATGYTDAEMAAIDPLELFPEWDRETVAERFSGLLAEDDEAPVVETELVDADGNRTPYEFVAASLTGPDGEVVAVTTTGRDISDRHALQELERQNERLDEFASLVSHDLRNPLTVAEGYLALVREVADNEDLQRVAAAHERMYDLIDDLLTLARDGNAVGSTVPVSLAETARSAWYSVGTRDATLQVTDDLTFDADPARLQNLFENLYRNSVEHGSTGSRPPADDDGSSDEGSDDGRTVTIRVGPLEDGFFVEDDGPGIPLPTRESVFESGYTTSRTGTGFGLAIVQSICEAHGWAVELADATDGGARFEVTLHPD